MLYELRIHHITRYLLPYLMGFTDPKFHEGYTKEHTGHIGNVLSEISSNPNNKVKVLNGKRGLDGICKECPENPKRMPSSESDDPNTDETDFAQFRIVEGRKYTKLHYGQSYTVKRFERLRTVSVGSLGANKN